MGIFQQLTFHLAMKSGELHSRQESLRPHLTRTFVFLSIRAKLMPVAMGAFSPLTPALGISCGKMSSQDWDINDVTLAFSGKSVQYVSTRSKS
jgi:hypothetical protein